MHMHLYTGTPSQKCQTVVFTAFPYGYINNTLNRQQQQPHQREQQQKRWQQWRQEMLACFMLLCRRDGASSGGMNPSISACVRESCLVILVRVQRASQSSGVWCHLAGRSYCSDAETQSPSTPLEKHMPHPAWGRLGRVWLLGSDPV